MVSGGAISGLLERRQGVVLGARRAHRAATGGSAAPATSVSVTGSGEGHANGQYVGETATRMRWPGPEGVADRTQPHDDLVAAPRLERLRRCSCESRCVRLRRPRAHEQRRARGATSQSADGTQRERPIGGEREPRLREAEDLRRARASGSEVKQSERPSSARWSRGIVARRSPSRTRAGVQAGQLRARDRQLGLVAGRLAENRRRRADAARCGDASAGGQTASATQRPGRSRVAPGRSDRPIPA